MNNGHTRESKHRIAVLEDEEVEVFTAFTQYAYTGNYTVPVQKSELPPTEPSSALTGHGASAVSDAAKINQQQQQQQQQQPTISAVRTQSSASFLPPPAPTPPPFERHDSKPGRRYVETPLATATAVDDQWENPFAHPVEQHQQRNGTSTRENSPPVEMIQETVEDKQHPEDEDQLLFPLSKRHGKKDKKKKRKDTVTPATAATAVFEETVLSNLTPPTTPPFGVRDLHEETNNQRDRRSQYERNDDHDPDCAIETDTGDDGDVDGDDSEWWNQPVSSQNEARREYEERLVHARRLQQQQHTVPVIDTSFASQRMSSTPRKRGTKIFNEFATLDYFHQQSGDESGVSTPTPVQTFVVPYILFHAKVYVFASRYLIPGLAQLCLQKLHTSLVDYPLEPPSEHDDESDSRISSRAEDIEAMKFKAHAKMLLDILRYTYENTTRFEPVSQTSATQLRECELRKLVAQYAACKMRELAIYTPASIPVPSSPSHGPGSGVSVITPSGGGLRELMDKTPELASDLVFLMM